MSTETTEYTFTVEQPAHLKVENISGKVTIEPGEAGTIQIIATKHTDKGDPEKTRIEVEQQADGSVWVVTKYNSLGLTRRAQPCAVDYAIQVPQQCSVKASNVSSCLEMYGLEGEFTLKSVSGELNLRDLTGAMKLSSVSGKINASGLHGRLKADNVSGKIFIQDAQIPSITGQTVSGDFKVESPLGDGPYTFNTVSGRVTLVVPGDTHCTITQNSISGSVKSNLPITSQRRSTGNQRVEVQGGGTAISLNSVSGQVRLLSPDAPQEAPAPEAVTRNAAPAAPKKNQIEILAAIERGEMSVEDALEAMNAS